MGVSFKVGFTRLMIPIERFTAEHAEIAEWRFNPSDLYLHYLCVLCDLGNSCVALPPASLQSSVVNSSLSLPIKKGVRIRFDEIHFIHFFVCSV